MCFTFDPLDQDDASTCEYQWDLFISQCMNEDTPWMWTNGCEAAFMLEDTYQMWDGRMDMDMDWEEYCESMNWDDCHEEDLVLRRKTNLMKMTSKRPFGKKAHATSSHALWRKQSAVKAHTTALLDKPAKKTQKKQDYSGYAYGAAAATVGIIATAALAKHYQNKKLSDDYVRA